MAKTQWVLLLITCITSAISLALLITSFLTNNWVIAEASNSVAIRNSEINYGLFGGSLTRYLFASGSNFQLTIICLSDEGACIYSCQQTPATQEDELRRILAGTALLDCPVLIRSSNRNIIIDYSHQNQSMSNLNYSNNNLPKQNDGVAVNEQYIKYGLWITTLIFLSIATLFAIFAALFAIVNIIFNPVEPIFSVLGLYIWNGIAALAILITLILWGALFGTSLSENIAITDTLRMQATYNSNDLAGLGFSYWILIVSMVFMLVNLFLLQWRKRLLEAEPQKFTISIQNDYTTMQF